MTSAKVKAAENLELQLVSAIVPPKERRSKENSMQQRTAGVAVVIALATAIVALAQPKGPTVTVKGEVVDMWCYMESGEHGSSHKTCATACAKGGNPIGIVDSKGELYVTAGLQDHQPAVDLLVSKMSEQVTVTGTLVTKGGVRMLFIKSVQ
jgi:hypothetical protein